VVLYSRLVDPQCQNYTYAKEDTERKLVHAVQVHQCSMAMCLVMKRNWLQCKRHAPFELSPCDWIDEDDSWGPKRTYAYINNWNPAILHSVRSNHNVKLISNGTETKDLAFYITNYVSQGKENLLMYLHCLQSALHSTRNRKIIWWM
jgi:hypothetical protein